MKYVFTLLFSLPLFVWGQQCKLTRQIDKFSREPKLTTGLIPLNTASLSIEANATDIDFFISVNNTGNSRCFDDASTANINFEGTRVKTNFRNSGTMNCDGYFHFTFRNTTTPPYGLQRLSTQKISTISLTGTDKTVVVITLTDEQKQKVLEAAACIANEAKTLIKQPQ